MLMFHHGPQDDEQWELQQLQQENPHCASQMLLTSTVLSPRSLEGLSALLHQENNELDSSPCSENVFWKPQVNNFNFHFITPFAAFLLTVSEVLITVKITDKTPSYWEPEWSRNFTLYKLNFSHFG